jgi:signal transduction histidine kinase
MFGNPATVARLDHAQAALSAEVQGLRELMASLRPPTLDEVGLEAALRDHVGAFAAAPAWTARSGWTWPAGSTGSWRRSSTGSPRRRC